MRYWRISNSDPYLNQRLFDSGYPHIYGGTLCGYYDNDEKGPKTPYGRICAGNLSQIEVGDIIVIGGAVKCYYVGKAISKPMYVFKKYGPLPNTPFMDADQDTKNKFKEHNTDPARRSAGGSQIFHDVACVKTVWSQKRPDGNLRIDGIADGYGSIPGACTEIKNPDAIKKINELLGQTEINPSDRKVNMEDNNLKAKLAAMLKQVKNIILTGAPGTGKTHLAKQIAMRMTGTNSEDALEKSGQFAFVQFHPSYDYTDFVEGLRPKKETEQKEIGFELKNGIFKEFCEKAIDYPDDVFVFIIDEINRGEISKIFGELFFSIDPGYRGLKGAVKTQYSNMHDDEAEKFYVPENVYIIGTMNDIDRSVESIDFAMRRRFAWVEIRASDTADEIFKKIDGRGDDARRRFDRLNVAISSEEKYFNESFHIGGAYFLKLNDYGGDYGKLWTYHIYPLLHEYLRGIQSGQERDRVHEKLKNAYELRE